MRISLAISFGLLSGFGGASVAPESGTKVITIFFARHAQSVWNVKKARGRSNNEKDVPLTPEGIKQVAALKHWWKARYECGDGQKCGICNANAVRCLGEKIWGEDATYSGEHTDNSATQQCDSDEPKSLNVDSVVFGVSNLQRAIETMLVFMSGLKFTSESKPVLHIVSDLQETSGGADAQTALGKGTAPFDVADLKGDDGSKYAEALKYFSESEKAWPETLPFTFDATANNGPQILGGVGGEVANRLGFTGFARRLDGFCDWLGPKAELGHTTFVLSGHSSFLKDFFNYFLRKKLETNLAEKILRGGQVKGLKLKLGNASMIKFKLKIVRKKGILRDFDCSIEPKSTQLLFGEWQVQGKVKNAKQGEVFREFVGESIEFRPESILTTCPNSSEGDD